MGIIELILWIITGAVLFYCVICVGYNLVLGIASFFYKKNAVSEENKTSFAVFIPAYKEDSVILNSVSDNLSRIDYPTEKYKLIVIADQLKEATINSLKGLSANVIIHQVFFEKSTKLKSLNSALSAFEEKGYDFAVILDADNVMDRNFLSYIDAAISDGFVAIQGRRKAKNKNNSLSILDGLSEDINNSILRKGGNVLGLSSPISGSGMAYDYKLLQSIFKSESALGGFDKLLQVRLLQRGIKIRFLSDAIVLDEKTDESEVFKNQRKRWLNSHFTYFSKFVLDGLKGIFQLNFDLFNMTIFIHGLLPRTFNILIISLFMLVSLITPSIFFLDLSYWLIIFIAFFLANVIAIPKDYWNMQLLKALGSVPKAIVNMFFALLKIKESKKSFIHTPHKSHKTNE